MLSGLMPFQNPFTWNENKEKGRNVYHDIVDWLGGLPYGVASEDEVLRLGRNTTGFLKVLRCKLRGHVTYTCLAYPRELK